jgi:cell division protein FtsB
MKRNILVKFQSIFIAAFFIFFVFSLTRSFLKLQSLQKKLYDSQTSLITIETEQKKLTEQIKISQSDFYIEKEARNQLSKAKEGEMVLILPPPDQIRKLSPRIQNPPSNKVIKPNWEKWKKIFF